VILPLCWTCPAIFFLELGREKLLSHLQIRLEYSGLFTLIPPICTFILNLSALHTLAFFLLSRAFCLWQTYILNFYPCFGGYVGNASFITQEKPMQSDDLNGLERLFTPLMRQRILEAALQAAHEQTPSSGPVPTGEVRTTRVWTTSVAIDLIYDDFLLGFDIVLNEAGGVEEVQLSKFRPKPQGWQ
jgi:hypothetical protein